MHAITTGVILGGSSSVVVMPALRTADAGPAVSTLLGLESALTDVLCIVATGVCVEVLTGGGAAADAGSVSLALLRTLGVGVLVGAAAGVTSLWVLRRVSREAQAFPIVLSFLLVLYVAADALDGSAPLAILTAAVFVGNAPIVSKYVGMSKPAEVGRALRGVHGQVTFMVKTFFFTFMGAMLAPPWSLILLGAGVALCLLAVRIPAVLATTAGMGLDRASVRMAHVCIPRGMAAGVLSGVPFAQGVTEMRDVPVVVFATVATSILVFATGFALARPSPTRTAPGPDSSTAPTA
jgi:NhaP-type Na+/H+ or K+/H+ antiporter